MVSNLSGYAVGGSGGSISSSGQEKADDGKYRSLSRLKRDYLDYLGTKREEIDEQQDSRRFRHGSHWTSEQIRQLQLRKQPIVHHNIAGRKINGIVGTLTRLKQDPKAYPRTPKHEEGAELATATLRYVLDNCEWDAKDPICAEMAAVDGIGGIEINIQAGDHGPDDHDIDIDVVVGDSFFYDPRSYQHDFSDARFMGVGKWMDVEEAVELFPDKEDDIRSSLESGSDLTSEPDREHKWFQSDGQVQRIRLVDHWYKKNGKWYYCIYTGAMKLMEGESYLIDENNDTFCKYIMFSAYVDQDGDRYGFVRDIKPLNLEVNMRKSKSLYTMLTRRIITPKGAFDDIELARREAARSDGVVEYNMMGDARPEFDDAARIAETEAQFKFYESAKTDLESFGPNIAVTGEGLESSSGRAIHLLQQAGLADLGPYIQSYRGWKIRVYRAVWNAVQHHWTAERWIRVTDDDDISEFIQINGMKNINPMTGEESPPELGGIPTLVNKLGSLDVDIILDEGPDTVNQMADAYDTLSILAGKGTEIPPAVLIELSPLPMSTKKRILEMLSPEPTPKQQAMEQIELKHGAGKAEEAVASAELKRAQAAKAISEVNMPQEQGTMQMPDHPMKTMSEAHEKAASADLKKAQTYKTLQEAMKIIQDMQLEPQRMAMEQQNTAIDRAQAAEDAERNFEINKMKANQRPKAA